MSPRDIRDSTMARIVARDISALIERRLMGSMPFVYLQVFFVGTWLAINLGWLPIRLFDPTFVILAMVA